MDTDTLRLIIFVALLSGFTLWEWLAPARKTSQPQAKRFFNHLSLSLMNSLVLRFLLPFTAFGTAVYAQQNGFGLLQTIPFATLIALILLDLSIYLQHIAFHHVPFLWRFHAMHHSDTTMDVTTGIRFHPVEALLSMAYKCAIIALLGVPPLAVIIFEILLNASSLFSHSNISPPFERLLRYLLVTPAMHEVHHSPLRIETNSNYGFNLSLWDRLFRTYRVSSTQSEFGLETHRDAQAARLDKLLTQPFK